MKYIVTYIFDGQHLGFKIFEDELEMKRFVDNDIIDCKAQIFTVYAVFEVKWEDRIK